MLMLLLLLLCVGLRGPAIGVEWLQRRPPELEAAAAGHVVAAAVLLDLAPAPRALLEVGGQPVGWRVAHGGPLVLADEAHHRVEPEVAQAHAAWRGAVNLHRQGVQPVLLQAPPGRHLPLQHAHVLGDQPCEPPGERLRAALPQAAEGDDLPPGAAARDLHADPAPPAGLARLVAAAVQPERGAGVVPADLAPLEAPVHGERHVPRRQVALLLVDQQGQAPCSRGHVEDERLREHPAATGGAAAHPQLALQAAPGQLLVDPHSEAPRAGRVGARRLVLARPRLGHEGGRAAAPVAPRCGRG
mmetsp:Transcript_56688/g.159944  ORF Transcript_56688/g.159944 Transcript_56688/m.159944 type:complete len:301 (-) Transcript_56688:76-978(-)